MILNPIPEIGEGFKSCFTLDTKSQNQTNFIGPFVECIVFTGSNKIIPT